jgi:hypothetical protein
MELLATEFEEGFAREQAVNVRQEQDLVILRQFDLRHAILGPAVNRSGNDRAGQASFVNVKANFFIDLAIVFDLLHTSAFGLRLGIPLYLPPCRYDSKSSLRQRPDK